MQAGQCCCPPPASPWNLHPQPCRPLPLSLSTTSLERPQTAAPCPLPPLPFKSRTTWATTMTLTAPPTARPPACQPPSRWAGRASGWMLLLPCTRCLRACFPAACFASSNSACLLTSHILTLPVSYASCRDDLSHPPPAVRCPGGGDVLHRGGRLHRRRLAGL